MNQKEEKKIQRKKKTGYNIYGIREDMFTYGSALICALIVLTIMQIWIAGFSITVKVILDVIVLVIATVVAVWKNRQHQEKVEAYRRQDGFEFIGLYDLSGEQNLKSSDILSREEEVTYLNQVLEDLIFRQDSVKQALCLTGKSGCGKSTILSFFQKTYGEIYQIYDFTGNYTNLSVKIREIFGTELEQELMRRSRKKKMIFILDQFERFFFLDEDKREQVRNLILALNRKNTALILSMREEYLADFMKEFDVNNMHAGCRDVRPGEKTGILNHLTSIIRDNRKNYYTASKKRRFEIKRWKGSAIKDRGRVHFEHIGGYGETTSLEPVGNTIFYCENQNDIKVRCNGTEEEASVLQSKCELLFGKEGKMFYEKHRKEPLIQQQITYHMAEYAKKVWQMSREDQAQMFELEDYELLNHYYDVQLASTGDYYNASRILYLLSSARLNHVVMNRTDLEYGLFENQFSKDGYRAVSRVIEKLEELQLIRRNISNSDQEYEIAHDFVAQTFLTYSHSNIDRNVKSALDIYMAEFLDANKAAYTEKKRLHSAKVQKSRFYPVIYGIFAVLVFVLDGMIHFGYNPWMHSLQDYNVYGSIVSYVPLLTTELSMLYLFHTYHKILQFYQGRRELLCKGIFIFTMLISACAVFCYPHGMIFYGIGLTAMGLNCAFLLSDSGQKASRLEMRNYGLKCAVMGVAFIFLHLVLLLFNHEFPVYIIFIEMVMMNLLIAYAYLAHLTKENLYGRRMDVSSERE